MADYVYSWKRLFDPRLASPHSWLFEGKVVGLDDLAKEAAKSNKFDYNKKVAGLEILDPYTLRVTLTKTDFNFPMILAYVPTAALAREVVEKYGDVKGEVGSNPVGTGYYTLGRMDARQPHRPEPQPAALAGNVELPGRRRSGRPAHRAPDAGQAHSRHRPH